MAARYMFPHACQARAAAALLVITTERRLFWEGLK